MMLKPLTNTFKELGRRFWRDKLMLCAALIIVPVWIILWVRALKYGSLHVWPFHVSNLALIGLGILTGIRARKAERRGQDQPSI